MAGDNLKTGPTDVPDLYLQTDHDHSSRKRSWLQIGAQIELAYAEQSPIIRKTTTQINSETSIEETVTKENTVNSQVTERFQKVGRRLSLTS